MLEFTVDEFYELLHETNEWTWDREKDEKLKSILFDERHKSTDSFVMTLDDEKNDDYVIFRTMFPIDIKIKLDNTIRSKSIIDNVGLDDKKLPKEYYFLQKALIMFNIKRDYFNITLGKIQQFDINAYTTLENLFNHIGHKHCYDYNTCVIISQITGELTGRINLDAIKIGYDDVIELKQSDEVNYPFPRRVLIKNFYKKYDLFIPDCSYYNNSIVVEYEKLMLNLPIYARVPGKPEID